MVKNIERRDFLKLGGLAGAATIAGGALVACSPSNVRGSAAASAGSDREWAGEADLVIVGGGGTGYSAAVEALEAGDTVLVIEKGSMMGGNTVISGGMIQAAGTKYEEELAGWSGDTAEKFAQEMNSWGCGLTDGEMVTEMCEESASHIDWMVELGRTYTACDVVPPVHGFDTEETWAPRCHWDPEASDGHFNVIREKAMQYDGLIEVMNTEAKHLILNDAGEVIGVEADAKGKTISYKAKKAVLIATAGLDDGKDLTRSLNPQAYWGTLVKEAGRAAPYANVPTNTGDGIRMGMEIGAAVNISTACVMSDLVYWGGVGGGKQYTGDQPQNRYGSTMTDGSILVNSRGNRFCQEDAHWGYVTSEIYHAIERSGALRDDPIAANVYAISSGQYVSQWGNGAGRNLDEDIANGFIFESDTIEGLAEQIGVPTNSLSRTVARWNEICEAGEDPDFSRKVNLTGITDGPFYARVATPFVMGTAGGLKVNSDLQVLDTNGDVIPRLYCGGMAAGGWVGPFYYSCGWAVLGTVHHGRKVGKAVALLEAWDA